MCSNDHIEADIATGIFYSIPVYLAPKLDEFLLLMSGSGIDGQEVVN